MAFGERLRRWRLRRGWSQEKLAEAAGTAVRHVSRLETGRALPSRAMVRALSDALGLAAEDVDALLVSAGHAAGGRPSTAPGTVLLAAVGRVLRAHEPAPAVALDRDWVVVAHNDAARLLGGGASLIGRDVVGIAADPAGPFSAAPDRDRWWSELLARAADQAARHPGSALARRVADLGPTPASPTASLAVPLELELDGERVALLVVTTRFAVPGDPAAAELTVETFLPADEGAQRALERLAAVSATR